MTTVGMKRGDVGGKDSASHESLPWLPHAWAGVENVHKEAGFCMGCPGSVASISRPEQDAQSWGCFPV